MEGDKAHKDCGISALGLSQVHCDEVELVTEGSHEGGKSSRGPHGSTWAIHQGHRPAPECPSSNAEAHSERGSVFPGVSRFRGLALSLASNLWVLEGLS